MANRALVILFSALALLAACASPQPAWQAPFDSLLGADIVPLGNSTWSIEGGVALPERGEARTYLGLRDRYSDFELRVEVFVEGTTNSGVFVRCPAREPVTPFVCYEFNIWDAHPDSESRTGAVVAIAAPLADLETENRWSAVRVRVEGNRLCFWIDDILMNDVRDDRWPEGYIALQYGGENGMVRFRNLQIREL